MTLTSLKTLINTSLTTAGYEVGALSDLSWVDVGTAIGSLTADQFKNYQTTFALGVIQNYFDTRTFKKSLDLQTSTQEYNGLKQYVKAGLLSSSDPSIVGLTNGTDYNDRVYKSLTTDVLLTTKDEGFMVSWSVPQSDLKTMFSSEEGAMGYVSLINASVASSLNRNKYNIQLSLLAKLILSAKSDSRAVNLVTLYNASHTAQVATATCLESADFKNWCKETVANLRAYMTDITKKYNDGQISTFTPEEDVRMVLLTSFSNSMKNISTYNGIGEGALSLDDYQTVNAWQNNGSSDLLPALSVVGAISDLNGSGDTVTASNVVGVLFDRYSCSYTLKTEKVTSDYVPKGDFTNFFANVVGQSFVNTRNNALVLTLN